MSEYLESENNWPRPGDAAQTGPHAALRRRAAAFKEAWGADGQWIQPEDVERILDELATAEQKAQEWLDRARHESERRRNMEDERDTAEAERDALRAAAQKVVDGLLNEPMAWAFSGPGGAAIHALATALRAGEGKSLIEEVDSTLRPGEKG